MIEVLITATLTLVCGCVFWLLWALYRAGDRQAVKMMAVFAGAIMVVCGALLAALFRGEA